MVREFATANRSVRIWIPSRLVDEITCAFQLSSCKQVWLSLVSLQCDRTDVVEDLQLVGTCGSEFSAEQI